MRARHFATASDISRPILNSACVAAVYEGLAVDFDQAEAMILAGEITLQPAQDHEIVTPLAAVVSASMPLHSVYDAWGGRIRALAPINGGAAPSLRLGLRSQAVLDHIRWLNSQVRDALRSGLGEGIALTPLAVAGLHGGDDCHGRTPVSNAVLLAELQSRARRPLDADVVEFLAKSPSMFLNLWMAATKSMMRAADGTEDASLITAAGGNGQTVGIQIAGVPGHWFTAPATPPLGRFDVDLPPDRALGAIGDSAVIEGFGLGAMAWQHSPAQRDALGSFVPDSAASRK